VLRPGGYSWPPTESRTRDATVPRRRHLQTRSTQGLSVLDWSEPASPSDRGARLRPGGSDRYRRAVMPLCRTTSTDRECRRARRRCRCHELRSASDMDMESHGRTYSTYRMGLSSQPPRGTALTSEAGKSRCHLPRPVYPSHANRPVFSAAPLVDEFAPAAKAVCSPIGPRCEGRL